MERKVVIKVNYKLISEIKKHVQEFTKKMFYDIRSNTNQIRIINSKIHRLENSECKCKLKENKDGLKESS